MAPFPLCFKSLVLSLLFQFLYLQNEVKELEEALEKLKSQMDEASHDVNPRPRSLYSKCEVK